MNENKFMNRLSTSIEEALKTDKTSKEPIAYSFEEVLVSSIDIELDILLEGKKLVKPSCFLSQTQIDEHYDVHYKGYVEGYKEAKKFLKQCSLSCFSEYRSALLDISFNFNGVLLHEIYFESLGKSGPSKKTKEMVDSSFGGQDKLEESLKAALMGSRGWILLGYNKMDKSLMLTLVDDHDIHGMYTCLVLALDVWEHAYYIDYKSNKDRYVDALINDINWDAVSKRIDELL